MNFVKKYIGTKLVKAYSCSYHEAIRRLNRPMEAKQFDEPGYLVIYPDGYESWSPKVVFEEAYRQADNMPFGMAVEAMMKGHAVARKGWNGKDMFIRMIPGNNVQEAIDSCFRLTKPEDRERECLDFIIMKTADNKYVIGWLASQTDMLSDDWFVVW